MESASISHAVTLPALVPVERWQRLQEHFTRVLGVPLRTVGPFRELLTAPSWPGGLETDGLITRLRIGEELERLLPLDRLPADITTFVTPIGVTYAAVPVRAAADHIVAYVVAGPMLVGPREDEQRFRERVSALGLDPSELWPLLLSLRLYSFVGIRSALGLLEDVGAAIAQLAHQLAQLTSLATPAGGPVERVVSASHSGRVFQALLEAAVMATHADGGSVMLYDAGRDAMTIRAAQGLSPDVMSGAEVKRGEGIAGLAVAERRTLVVDADAGEPVRSRMRRPQLASSLVVPLAPGPEREPIGVLNLWSLDPSRRFTLSHQELLRRLLELASLSLRA